MKFQPIFPSVIAITFAAMAMLQPLNLAASSSVTPATTKTATPAMSPTPGSYGWDEQVKLTTATAGAAIYYTTNGATPTTASTKYKAPFVVSKTETIRAIAVASGHTESAVAKGVYTLFNSLDIVIATASGKNVVTVPVGGVSAFVVAVKDTSAKPDPNFIFTTSKSPAALPVEVTVCQTNPSTGQCLSAPEPSTSITTLAAGADKTFAVFVEAHGTIANNPSENRITVQFKNAFGLIQSSASIPVYTTK